MLLYRIATQLYFTAIRLAALFGNKKAALWVSGRRNLFEDIEGKAAELQGCYWFHCASLGEFEQGRPVIERIKKELPQQKIVLTFFSPSGYEVRKNYTGVDAVFYLPADSLANAKQFINLLKPKVALFIKYEFWQSFLYQLKKQAVPTFLVSGIFRKEQHFFKWYGKNSRKVFSCFSHLFVQNEESKALLQNIDVTNVAVIGDTRFDRVYDISRLLTTLKPIEDFANGNKLFIAGSTWPADEKLIAALATSNMVVGWKFIIAPHEVNEKRIAELLALFPKAIRYTEAKETDRANAQVMILDTIGTLSTVYRYAAMSYVGGGFNNGIHNVLEAAVYGHPVLFGPNYKRFAEAVELIRFKGAVTVSSEKQFLLMFKWIKKNTRWQISMSFFSQRYVRERAGATDKIYNHFKTNGLL